MSTLTALQRLALPISILGLLLAPLTANAAVVPSRIHLGLTPFVRGLSSPLLVTHAGDGSGRLFVVEQTGSVRIIDRTGTLVPASFIDLSRSVSGGGEQGLLGLAFHPGFGPVAYSCHHLRQLLE